MQPGWNIERCILGATSTACFALLAPIFSCAAPTSEPAPVQAEAATAAGARAFPPNFVFGSAIAGFQVEMGCPTIPADQCEDRNSDWYQWITTKRINDNPLLFMSGDAPSKGPGFYETYDRDVARVADVGPDGLGNGSLRISIEWSRIFPKPTFGVSGHDALKAIASKEGVDFYHRVLASMKARGLRPFVTVNHYTLPLWIHDGAACNESLERCIDENKAGWANPNRAFIVDEIAKYAGFLGDEYGAEVDLWASLNEPFTAVVVPGYLLATPARTNPPGRSGPWMNVQAAKMAASAMVEAHARIYDALKEHDRVDADGNGKPAEVGIVYAYTAIEPASSSAEDRTAALHARYGLQDMFMDGVALGRLDETWDHAPGTAPVRADLANRLDFVGINYYFRLRAKPALIPLKFISPYLDFDLTTPLDGDYPQGIRTVLADASKYGKPLYITETGVPQDDPTRGAAWFVRTLSEISRAITDGIDVRGYYAWSLMDNYEWNQGMKTRFGLYAVDPVSKNRTIRPAGRAFGQISKARAVSPELEARYANVFPN